MPSPSDKLIPISGRQLAAVGAGSGSLPLMFLRSPGSGKRFWEFFTANIRNRNTRKAYFIAVTQFSVWCESQKLTLNQVQPVHVAAYVEQLMQKHSKPTVKQHLAAIRMLFDWLVTGQVIPANPAHSVRGPRHSVKMGKTSVLSAEEMRYASRFNRHVRTDRPSRSRTSRNAVAGCGSTKKAAG